eukprot:CAMPEP_0113935292 /NCGR_PEP_ID=MMETSP1339-20121228/2461_1 /TAXON_ID=94617 /ORGANISM="Fibrocapsa japonica" /LENGTH=201 /DNA_ID=CAMNT_0000937387 /DNA_START=87 /DNA_END=692 /DNA_ORIENTATION=+ /assembly_acc=CAM_ASM_000762
MAPIIQKAAPDFSCTALLPDGQFGTVSLSDYAGKYVVLFFYPLDFTFVCPTEITAFSDAVDEFKAMDCEVIGCSVDSEFSHLAWTNIPRREGGLGQMKIPILADLTKKVSSDYGVLIEEAGVALRGVFIIDGKGVLRQMTVNDLPVGRNVEEVVRLVKAFKFTDEHGEVCPMGWKPGKKSMKADVSGSKEYFAAAAEESKS